MEEANMKVVTTIITAAFVAASASVALAQGAGGSGAGGGAGAGAGAGTSGAGSDPSVPRQNMTRPTPNTPPVNRRGDEMAPMQGSNVSNQTMTVTKKKKHRSYR